MTGPSVHSYTWTWVGDRLVGMPTGPVDPARLVVRHVTPEALAEEFGIERQAAAESDDPGSGASGDEAAPTSVKEGEQEPRERPS